MRPNTSHHLAEYVRRGLDQNPDLQPGEMDLVLVDEVPVGDRGLAASEAEHDDAASDPLGGGQARLEGGAADPSSTRSTPAPSVRRRTSAASSLLRESRR
jgi:hypothetical protein